MRRLKSIASGRSSFSDNLSDSGSKRVKLEGEGLLKATGEQTGDVSISSGVAQATRAHMAPVSTGLVTAPNAGNASLLTGLKVGPADVEQLPREMHGMTIRDPKAETGDDKDIEAAVVDGNGAETGHIIVTTIGGKNGQPKQQTVSYMAERIVGTGSFGVVFQVSG